MRNTLIAAFGVAAATLFAAAPAAAQNTQSWVASTGSDAAACTRAAPCATFTAALAATNATGQINCADGGNYGAVTITKAIVIECDVGSIVVTSGSAITVAAGASDVVTLRGLQIDGALASTGNGVVLTSAEKLVLDKVNIGNFLGNGITVAPTASTQLVLLDSALTNNGSASAQGALLVQPGAVNVTVSLALNRVNISGNAVAGVRIKTTAMTGGGVTARIRQTTIAGNSYGVLATAGASTVIAASIEDSDVTRNTNQGLAAAGATAQIFAINSVITGNGTGVNAAGGTVMSTGDNLLYGNTLDGAFSGTVAPL
jgi:hypothetical protein